LATYDLTEEEEKYIIERRKREMAESLRAIAGLSVLATACGLMSKYACAGDDCRRQVEEKLSNHHNLFTGGSSEWGVMCVVRELITRAMDFKAVDHEAFLESLKKIEATTCEE